MNHLAAAVLLHLGGKTVDENGIKAVIEAAGSKADDAKIKSIVAKLKGQDVLKFARENIGKVSGGAAPVEAKKDNKKEEKKDDKKKETKKKQPEPEPEDDDVGLGLF